MSLRWLAVTFGKFLAPHPASESPAVRGAGSSSRCCARKAHLTLSPRSCHLQNLASHLVRGEHPSAPLTTYLQPSGDLLWGLLRAEAGPSNLRLFLPKLGSEHTKENPQTFLSHWSLGLQTELHFLNFQLRNKKSNSIKGPKVAFKVLFFVETRVDPRLA